MLWLAAGLLLVLYAVSKKFKKKKLWFVPFTLLTLAVCTIADAPMTWIGLPTLGACLAWCVKGLLWFPALWLGVTVGDIATVLLYASLVLGIVDLVKDKKPDGWAKTMLFALPALTLLGTGPIAEQIRHVTHIVSDFGPSLLA